LPKPSPARPSDSRRTSSSCEPRDALREWVLGGLALRLIYVVQRPVAVIRPTLRRRSRRGMSASTTPAGWTREAAIAVLRERLLRMTDGEHSICRVAADRGIFCRGFRRWNDHEFHARWKATFG
jgi:hypothetical protein